MADNILITPGAGATAAADDIGGVLFQRMKLIHGTDGVNAGDVSTVNGLPIQGTQSAVSSSAWTSATALNTANSISIVGMNTVTVVLIPTTTFTGGVLTFEVSPDGTNWVPIAMARIDSFTVETTYTIVASTNRAWSTSVDGFTNFRVRLSTAITGTGTATVLVTAQAMPIEPIVTVGQSLAANLQAQINGTRQDVPTAVTPAAGQPVPPQVSNLGQQWVVQARPKRVQVTSAGLTTATNAYAAGDQVGTLFTFAGMAFANGGGGYIESILLNDEAAIIGPYTLWIFRSAPTLAADNAAFSLSDADAELLVGDPITLGTVRSAVNNFSAGWYGALPYDCAATSLFVALQTNAAHTFFAGGVGSLKLTLTAAVLG